MPKQQLSSTFVAHATCQENKQKTDYFDTKVPGLLLKVLATGKKSFYLRYRDLRGKQVEVKIADANIVKVCDVRELATSILAKLVMGEDPFEKKAELKKIPTFAEFINERYLPFVKGYKKSWEADDSYLRNHLLPALGKKHLDEISKHDVIQFHHGMKAKQYALGTCNRCLILLRYAMNLAIRWEIPGIQANPTKDVPLFEDPDGQKERYLTSEEAQRLYAAVRQSPNSMLQYIISMLILTGARKREVLDAQWHEFDLVRKQWRIQKTKAGKPRFVPLSDGVLQLLAQVPRIKHCDYVFANPKTGKPFVSIFVAWDSARKHAGLSDVRIHDLRHSFASFLVNAGRSLYEVQKILGHTQVRTTQRYAHLSQETLIDAANEVAKSVPLHLIMPSETEQINLLQASR